MNFIFKQRKNILFLFMSFGNIIGITIMVEDICFRTFSQNPKAEDLKKIIVNPADIPTTDKDKRQKEDKRDSRKLAKSLKNEQEYVNAIV